MSAKRARDRRRYRRHRRERTSLGDGTADVSANPQPIKASFAGDSGFLESIATATVYRDNDK